MCGTRVSADCFISLKYILYEYFYSFVKVCVNRMSSFCIITSINWILKWISCCKEDIFLVHVLLRQNNYFCRWVIFHIVYSIIFSYYFSLISWFYFVAIQRKKLITSLCVNTFFIKMYVHLNKKTCFDVINFYPTFLIVYSFWIK